MVFLKKVNFILLFIFLIGGFFRFYNINWDQGHYLHPDERLYINSSNISLPKNLDTLVTPESPLNPKMFYYGAFPLYVYKFLNIYLFPSLSFIIVSRAVSALFSTFTILLTFLISEQLFSKRTSLIASFIFAFSAGSIQSAHFNTTESLLVFFITLITFLCIVAVRKESYYLFIPIAILLGISIGTKITGLTFIVIPGLSFFFLMKNYRKFKKNIAWIFMFPLVATISSILSAPYQLIDFSNFVKEQSYMQNVILGSYKPPFTIIYEKTIPYLYQISKIFPFAFGFLSFPLAIAGLVLLTKKFMGKEGNYLYTFIILFPLIYFFWVGSWFAKFTRYYILLFPFLSIWAAYIFQKVRKDLSIFLLILIAINGALFLKVYTKPNTRLQASAWIYENVPNRSSIAGEHWDDNLPLVVNTPINTKSFIFIQLPVYDLDTPSKINKLTKDLSKSNYFVISSRRVYYSIVKNKHLYPLTSLFYKELFEGKLGFKLVKKFTNYPFYFSDDFADESFQSYDHPPVLIFKNEESL